MLLRLLLGLNFLEHGITLRLLNLMYHFPYTHNNKLIFNSLDCSYKINFPRISNRIVEERLRLHVLMLLEPAEPLPRLT